MNFTYLYMVISLSGVTFSIMRMKIQHHFVCFVLGILFFSLNALGQQGVITSVSPNSGTPGQTLTITIVGSNTHFQNGVSSISFPGNSKYITVTNQQVSGKSKIYMTATIHIASNAPLIDYPLVVTTGSYQESTMPNNGFTVFNETGTGKFVANLQILPYESINVKNIDLTSPTSQPVAFMINEYSGSKTTLTVNVSLSAYEGYASPANLIGTMTYNGQVLPANTSNTPVTISNRQFTGIKLSNTLGNTFLNYLETTGTFPPGNYTYSLVIRNATNGDTLAVASDQMEISNPQNANPELIAPGTLIENNLQDCYMSYPLFQWFGIFDQYDFALYFWKPGQTAEEVVRGLPVYKQSGITNTSLSYPAFAEKLIDSADYAWQIMGEVTTASGVQKIPSQVFRFRYVNLGATGAGLKKTIGSIEIYPHELTILPGQSQQFTATFFDQDGVIIPDVNPSWEISPPGSSIISSTGLFTAGLESGTVAVLVRADTIAQFAPVTIGQANNQQIKNTKTPWNMNGILKKMFGVNP